MKTVLLLGALASAMLGTSPAAACTGWTATDSATGETWSSGSPEALRREQADWRERSGAVVLVQVRAGRLAQDGWIEFTLAPLAPVYGDAFDGSDLLYWWDPGDTCNRFGIAVSDMLVAYVGPDGGIVGVTPPGDLQDRPPAFGARLREIERGSFAPHLDGGPG